MPARANTLGHYTHNHSQTHASHTCTHARTDSHIHTHRIVVNTFLYHLVNRPNVLYVTKTKQQSQIAVVKKTTVYINAVNAALH